MTRDDIPTLLLGVTVCAYWLQVGRMILRVRRSAGRAGRVFIPAQRKERLMWLIWVPLVILWTNVPLAAVLNPMASANRWVALPLFAASPAAFVLRCVAVLVAMACLGLSIVCWRHMGANWRMAVDPEKEAVLIVDGPFSWVRHPIYSLSITLMVSSAVVLPSPIMLLLAVTHVSLLVAKVRNEERFMLERHGEAYIRYCAQVGRFLPILRPRSRTA